MSTDLLRPPTTLTPAEALHHSQQAPNILRQQSSWALPWPLSILTTSDAPEKWTIYENTFYSCIRTGDNRSAFACLEELRKRFGETNERVMALTGIYHEATASKEGQLQDILSQYADVVEEKPTNMVMRKRRIALLRSLGRPSEAVTALVELLDISPTDAEAWAELAELYFLQGLYAQAIYSLEEVLLVTPSAWNIHAKLAEVLYVAASTQSGEGMRGYIRSMKEFCRSIELCDDYLRGYYGLKLVTSKLFSIIDAPNSDSSMSRDGSSEDGYSMPSLKTVQRLNELATIKLVEIIRRRSTSEAGWDGYSEAEVIAARALLDRDTSKAPR